MLWLTGVAHFLIARVHGVHVVFGADGTSLDDWDVYPLDDWVVYYEQAQKLRVKATCGARDGLHKGDTMVISANDHGITSNDHSITGAF